ncbi:MULTISPECIES: hypothetical protein [unclassified Rhodanobacter]|uniref:hypothetical protein n=1 Tax=unclassified Rhodanobacter TaxID=2621553 RepID=UPI001BDF4084|nr:MULTISPECIES: hypothetical protein [unclassified Rhodanobacter]MBT2142732.1 hypothetical protein [Rhodanobacter sp. LX-99]MBT2148195.1 hypothetical protein [Rhodanobacter sp. LX-100]
MENSTAVVQIKPGDQADGGAFALAQRKASAYAQSTLVPQAYRDNVANVLIAMEIANRIGANELMVMQNLHVVQGRPSWSSSFLIATVNSCGRFHSMCFETVGTEPEDAGYKVRAYADDKGTGERRFGPWITWAMVKAEGWLSKNGSKWKTMPELMFMYRAAGFWSRVYAPEVSMGIHTDEEAEDIAAVRGVTVTQASRTPGTLRQIEQELTGAADEQPEGDRPGGDAPAFTVQEVHDAIANAASKDKLDEALDLVRTLPAKEQQSLIDLGKVVAGKFQEA